MRLPSLPKLLKSKYYSFHRRKRDNKEQQHVDYGVYDALGLFQGVVIYNFRNDTCMTVRFTKTNGMKKEFTTLLDKWRKQQQFNKEMSSFL